MLKLYNTLTKEIEEISKKDHLNLYTCGPTVYNFAHIGNLRAFIMADLLYRTLKYEGYNPHWVMNITDIDDKTIKGSLQEFGKDAGVTDLFNFTEKYLKAFKEDLKAVNVSVGEIEMIRVTDKMSEIQDFILKLLEKGFAYKADDGVYFSIEKYQQDKELGDYGQLVGEKFLEGKKVGARVAVDEYEKDNLSDFVLWKFHNPETDGQIFWPHPTLGNGRPGWHIECSVINQVAFKGEATDIHTGGVDLIFPHHTNEIAQSQPMYKPFVKVWYHNEHLLVDGERMGKRFNNFYTMKDLKDKGFSGQDLRYLYLTSSFISQQNFTFEALKAAHTSRAKLLNLTSTSSSPEGFEKALENNLNTAEALGLIWSVGAINDEVKEVLGFSDEEQAAIPGEVKQLLRDRQTAKQQKDFAKSDELRKQIEALGYEVMDTPEGQKIKKRLNI